MTTFAVPTPTPVRSTGGRWWMLVLPIALLGVGGLAYAAFTYWNSRGDSVSSYKFHAVAEGEMIVKVHKDGELQAVANVEVPSFVEGIATILTIVPEGKSVNKGDELITLDASAIAQKIEDTTIDLKRAESDVATARNVLQIQESTNSANLEAAEVDVWLAELSMKQYKDGSFPPELEMAKTALRMVEIQLANKEDDLKQTRDLYSKGFVNLADVKNAELAVETIKNDVYKNKSALDVLQNYTYPMMLAGKESYLKQSKQRLERTKVENQNNLTKAKTALLNTEAAQDVLDRRLKRLKEQEAFCKITAPSSGLVVYNNSSSRESSTTIQQGAQVRERQVLIRLPDTTNMKAVCRINESQVIRLREGQRAAVRITGIREEIGATVYSISPVADSSNRWASPDTREYPVEVRLDSTPPGLKPGLFVQVEIMVAQLPKATMVPLSALYASGQDTYVFVKTAGKAVPEARKISVGLTNETHVQVSDGLKPGEEIVLLEAGQGRDLMDKNGIKPPKDDAPPARKGGNRAAGPNGPAAKPSADGPPRGEGEPGAAPGGADRPRRPGGGSRRPGGGPPTGGEGGEPRAATPADKTVKPVKETAAPATGEPASKTK